MLNESEIRALPAAAFLCFLIVVAIVAAFASAPTLQPLACSACGSTGGVLGTGGIGQQSNENLGTWPTVQNSDAQTETESGPGGVASSSSAHWSTGDWIAVISSVMAFFQFLALIATVVVMMRSSKQQLRAYVTALPEFVSSFDTTNYPWIRFKITNIGQTPAHRLRHSARIDVFPYPLPPNFQLPALSPPGSTPMVVFSHGPDQGVVTCHRHITSSEISDIRSGSKRIYIYGLVEYLDVWKKQRTTQFFRSITGDSTTLASLTSNYIPSDLQIRFEVAPIHNDAT